MSKDTLSLDEIVSPKTDSRPLDASEQNHFFSFSLLAGQAEMIDEP